jgi:hypothetical protein
MERRTTWWCPFVLLGTVGWPAAAGAQVTGQLWGNLTVDWLATGRLTYEIDLEPRNQVIVRDGQPAWIDLHTTPHVSYALAPWIDVLAEVDFGFKREAGGVSSRTVTPRVGVQLHILSRILQPQGRRGAERERPPRRRLDISTRLRVEDQRSEVGSGSGSSWSSSWRLRDRTRIAYPLNRPKTSADGAVYLSSDAELFFPLDRDERGLVSEVRLHAGVGYRPGFAWRIETLYLWIGRREGASGALAVKSHAADIRVRRQF